MKWFTMAVACSVVALMVALMVACDGGGGAPTPTGQATDVQQGHAGAGLARDAGHDLAAINVCALIPHALVSQITEMTAAQAGTRRDHGRYTQGCEYALQAAPGRPGYEYVAIDIQPAEMFGSLDEALQSARTMGQHLTGERVAGIGSDAYVTDDPLGQSLTLHVLLPGDVALAVRADTLEHAVRLARAAQERLDGKD